MANPHFLLFDAQFAYESLALPLALFVLFALVLGSYVPASRQRGLTLTMCFGLGAVVITHHVTSYLLVALLLLWTLISFLQSRNLKEQASPGGAALLGLVLSIAWLIYTGDIALGYLTPHLTSAVFQVEQIFIGEMATRQLFVNGAGFVTPLWERLMAFASVGLILLGLPFGLFQIWRYQRANALALALTGGALAYPVSQVLRLTAAGAESADRATEFLFLGIAFVLAVGVTEVWLSRTPKWRRSAMIVGAVAVIFVGQVIAGSPPWFRMPGPYLVSADPRSIEPEGVAAAQWVDSYLGVGQTIASDRINTLLMATYGDEPASLIGAGVFNTSVVPVFTSLQFGPNEEAILQQDKIQYIAVDRRLSTGLPWVGTYFGQSTSWRSTKPMDPAALAKFDSLKNVSRLFDSGDIIIYDVKAISNPPSTVATPQSSCVPTSRATASTAHPNLVKQYTGKIYDVATGITTSMSLTGIQQQQGGICGYFSGLARNGSFKGTISAAKQIQFIVTSDTGQVTFSFDGLVRPNGGIAGTYCSPARSSEKCSDYGVWSLSPATES
jgi:hypothetical protein